MTRWMRRDALTVAVVLTMSFTSCAKPAANAPRPATTPDRPTPVSTARRPMNQGRGYIIKFDRPDKLGLRYRDVTTGTVSSRMIINGSLVPAQSHKMSFVYEAVVTVKSVHSSGRATKKELKITRLQQTRGGVTRDLLPRYTVVLAQRRGRMKSFSVHGKPVAKDAHTVLDIVVSLYSSDYVSTDVTPIP